MKSNQIKTLVRAFRDSLPLVFPGRTNVCKTFILARDESYADEIIQAVNDEFLSESKDFCQKITYRATEDSQATLADFLNLFNPRIVILIVE